MDDDQGDVPSAPDWDAKIRAALDLEALARIDAELALLGVGARRWRMAVIQRKNALKGNVALAIASAAQAQHAAPPPVNFAASYGLPTPDGRRLHAYRLATENFTALRDDLARRRTYDALQIGHVPGLFVLFASEWFRRCYAGGMRRWEDLARALDLPAPSQMEQSLLRGVTRRGMQQWQRPVYADAMMQYLATLAREGGFPAYAVADGAQGWARAMLTGIVRPLMGAPAAGEVEALAWAKGQSSQLPGVFSDAEFIQLCADLALAIVQVRRETEPQARAAGLPLAAWLGLNQPDWRAALPISTGDADADALVETLLQVEAVSSSVVGVDRMLLCEGKGLPWREAVRIGLDGHVSGGAMTSVDRAYGRLRAFAAGPMARHLPGELALFEPPGLGELEWSARSGRQVRGILLLPFACSVQLDLRAGERPVARIELPGGKPRRGQLLVARLEEGTSDAPRALRIVGAGSGSYRAAELFLQVPSDWAVLAGGDGCVTRIGHGEDDTIVWRIAGDARLTDPFNDCFRVQCGQVADQTPRLAIFGDVPSWAEVTGPVDLFVGPPHVSRNGEGELVLRPIGRRSWLPASSKLPVGHYDLGWRYQGIMLDRRRIAVLPSTAELQTNYLKNGTEYEISNFSPATIAPAADAPVQATKNGEKWVQRPTSGVVYRFDAQIDWPSAPPLSVSIGHPAEACIARWDGRVLPNRAMLTLSDLRDLVAIDRGDMTLLADLRDPLGAGRAEMSWSFLREMPLSAVAGDIESLLLPASLDAEVVLDMNNGINTNWHVRRFPLSLQKEGPGFVASEAIAEIGVQLCGRAIADPLSEVCFGPYSLLSDANHRPVTLPLEVAGDWLVFLRVDDRVLTRPLYIAGSYRSPEPTGRLAQAMAQPFGTAQDRALDDFLKLADSDKTESISAIGELLLLIAGLRGLPPVTFNVLKKLPAFPGVLAKMAFQAVEAERDAVMDLALSLPFAWFLIPRTCWKSAEQATGLKAMELLKALADAPRFANEIVGAGRRALIDRQPLLEAVFGSAEQLPLEDATQAFLRRARQRIPASSGTRYRSKLGSLLPDYFLRFDQDILDALDAPCAAALAAKEAWTPSTDDIRQIKLAARTYPTWFAEAYAASIEEN